MSDKERIKALEQLVQELDRSEEQEKAEQQHFEKFARHLGGGAYGWRGLFSSDLSELFLLGVLGQTMCQDTIEEKVEEIVSLMKLTKDA